MVGSKLTRISCLQLNESFIHTLDKQNKKGWYPVKKIVAVVMVLMMIAPLFPAFADGTWYCPKCGQQNTDNFCPKDGTL